MKRTQRGKVVYPRPKHYMNAIDIMRMLLHLYPKNGITWSRNPLEYVFLHMIHNFTTVRLGEKSLRKAIGAIGNVDPMYVAAVRRYGWDKLPKTWRIYSKYRDRMMDLWAQGTLQTAADFVSFTLEFLGDWEDRWQTIEYILHTIFQ